MIGSEPDKLEFAPGIGEDALNRAILSVVELYRGAQLRDAEGILNSTADRAGNLQG